MSDNEQELLKLETEVYHSDGGIYFAECDTAPTRDEVARRLMRQTMFSMPLMRSQGSDSGT